jgi:hypothetical protein
MVVFWWQLVGFLWLIVVFWWLMVVFWWLMVVFYVLLVVFWWLMIVFYVLMVVFWWLRVVFYVLMVVFWWLMVVFWWLMVDFWWLMVVFWWFVFWWLLVVFWWLIVVFWWLMIVFYDLGFTPSDIRIVSGPPAGEAELGGEWPRLYLSQGQVCGRDDTKEYCELRKRNVQREWKENRGLVAIVLFLGCSFTWTPTNFFGGIPFRSELQNWHLRGTRNASEWGLSSAE